MMRLSTLILAVWIFGGVGMPLAAAYPVAQALSLKELEKEAGWIAKVKAGDSTPADPNPYRAIAGFDVVVTELKVLEVYKGDSPPDEVASFVHYTKSPQPQPMMFMPQHYELEPGECYILFAKKTDRPGAYQQLWEDHHSMEDQGLVLAADDSTHRGAAVRDVLWTELVNLLSASDRQGVLYAIRKLDEMSGSGYSQQNDFERFDVLTAVEPLVRSPNQEVTLAAIHLLGSRNPYQSPSGSPGWLATVGKGSLPGYSGGSFPDESPARTFWEPLAEVANSERPAEIRAAAILALGLTREPLLQDSLNDWLVDPEPRVRAAAATLLADFPDWAGERRIQLLARDPEPAVRTGIARAIGYGQWSKQIRWLRELIDDSDAGVAEAAAMSLLSLPLDESRTTLQGLVDHKEYWPLVVNALAAEKPDKYLDALCDIVQHDRRPEHWWGGSIPWGVSWDILFRYVQHHPGIASQRLNMVLDALESPDYFSSSEPRDLYALYLQRGMSKRAEAFRAACRRRLTYDIDYYFKFKMVDANPQTYKRE